ncbi:glycosyltransferase involved in cell wall biosynthesis [Mesorhizobium soli]|uniref:glycosyltransferase family 4 protein n=1 Tax=Pseudaminobacter soli (ex Li et al. 2025) TaxID=1295366 RepID=UPI0024755877|nr:glycosyltransferase family 4 protein [Mesorhizobium soli]MDH6232835.1 glycosyltransferase involved in cell wall biosynthesis [Mesorhizobium soli]
MRIAHIAPLYESVPPKFYGGTERIICYLVDELVRMGHDITLFSSADSRTSARLAAVRDQALRLDPYPLKSATAAHYSMLDEVRRRSAEFDILHFHLSHFLHFPFFEHMPERTVTTPHGRLDYKDLRAAYRRWPRFPMISISHSQRRPLEEANWVGTIHHGMPLDLYRPLDRMSADAGYLAFLGRLSRDKRPDRAIEIARRTGMRLKIAAKIGDDDRAYFHEAVEPLIDGQQIEYLGEIGEAEKQAFLGNAAALILPIDWPEPFGLVAIEAMACGTPVIAWNNGALPEVVDQGVTGFIVSSVDAAVLAVAKLEELDRGRVRVVFERRFSVSRMTNDYMRVYERLIDMSHSPASQVAS